MGTFYLLVSFILFQAVNTSTMAAAKTYTANQWRGEYLDKKHGLIYIKAAPKGKLSLSYNFTMTVKNLLTKNQYRITQTFDDLDRPPSKVWKLPSGKYTFITITIIDNRGVSREGTPNGTFKRFLIKSRRLSNLGKLTLKVKKRNHLKVNIKMIKNSYIEPRVKAKNSYITEVINGYNGIPQLIMRRAQTNRPDQKRYQEKNDLRAIITHKYIINMRYKLNLFRHNYYAKQMMGVIEAADNDLRQCYKDRLEFQPKLKGKIKFLFIKAQSSGSLKSLKHGGGTLSSPKMLNCLFYKLAALTFPANRNMIGELIFDFRTTEK